MKTTVLKYLLLDANVIIYLYTIGLWKAFTERFDLSVSSEVAREVTHYPDRFGNKSPINLKSEKVTILEMDAQKAYNAIYSTIDKSSGGPDIQMGEIESIALLLKNEHSDLVFCTADGAAVIAACLLGLKERIISLEETMLKGGMKRNIKRQFTRQRMKEWKKKGEINLIQGVGLSKKNK